MEGGSYVPNTDGRHRGYHYYQMQVSTILNERSFIRMHRFYIKDRKLWVEGYRIRYALDVNGFKLANRDDLVIDFDEKIAYKMDDIGYPVIIGSSGDDVDEPSYTLIGIEFDWLTSGKKILPQRTSGTGPNSPMTSDVTDASNSSEVL
jgi:hypothetical protein